MINLDKNSEKTKLTCLLGSPVAHSKSPLMHNKAFEVLSLDYVYECFDVKEDEVEEAFDDLKKLGVIGFNCTMPDKIKAFELSDVQSTAATIIGAANTIVNIDGKFIAHNTDGIGFVKALSESGINIKGKKMSILGAGGAASAIIVQSALDGMSEIDVLSIKDEFFNKIEKLVDKLNEHTDCKINLIEMSDENIKKSVATSDILTNATPVGMAPNENKCLIQDSSILRCDLVVMDIIYNPLETKLVKLAKNAGCKTFNGIDMLLYQGAASFELWTKKKFPTQIIKDELYKSL